MPAGGADGPSPAASMEDVDALAAQLRALTARCEELRLALADSRRELETRLGDLGALRRELAERDHRIGELVGVGFGRASDDAWAAQERVALETELERVRGELEAMRSTRVWRAGSAWWRFRDRVRGRR